MKITIFIPTYNSGEILRETLDSVISQTYENIEVLIVDDSSTDDVTMRILKEYEAKDGRIKVFQKPNQGCVPFAWNYVMPHIIGDFTLYMSHDDLLASDAVERFVEVAKSDDEIDHVAAKMVCFRNNPNSPEPEYQWFNQRSLNVLNRTPISGFDAFVETLDFTLTGFGIWRTTLIRNNPVPTDTFNEDEYMQRIWRLKSRKVAFADAGVYYRQSPTGILRGFKLYHYEGLKVHDRLVLMMDEFKGKISVERYSEVLYNHYKHLRICNAWFRNHKNQYTAEERLRIEKLLKESHSVIGPRLMNFRTDLRSRMVKLSGRFYWLFNFLGKFDKW